MVKILNEDKKDYFQIHKHHWKKYFVPLHTISFIGGLEDHQKPRHQNQNEQSTYFQTFFTISRTVFSKYRKKVSTFVCKEDVLSFNTYIIHSICCCSLLFVRKSSYEKIPLAFQVPSFRDFVIVGVMEIRFNMWRHSGTLFFKT